MNPAPIDFWFDFSSPYSYLLNEKIDELAARYGRAVRRHPILLGIVFKATGSAPLTLQFAPKAAYSVHDFARSARFMGIAYRHPDKFPLATQNAARAFYWLAASDPAQAQAFTQACFRALFVDNRDISDSETLFEIAAQNGVDRKSLENALQDPAIKARLKDEVDQALARGIFGAPYVVIDGEAFFGADRLPQIEQWLATGGF